MKNHVRKKHDQLGMNPSTASNRLIKDIIFDFVGKNGMNKCHHCGKQMLRENFSIEHIVPWLDSVDPAGIFFNINNIAYSHLSCNVDAARKNRIYDTPEQAAEATRIKAAARRRGSDSKYNQNRRAKRNAS